MPHDEIVPDPKPAAKLSRRSFLRGAGAAGAAAVIAGAVLEKVQTPVDADDKMRDDGAALIQRGKINLTLHINGNTHPVSVEPRTTLLSAMRYAMSPALTGTKVVCDRGSCGACTVLLDGRSAYSCMILAADAVDKKIVTVEGLSGSGEKLHPIQEAFVAHDALQCGFCTPGFVMSVKALLAENPNPSLEDVRHGCAGNVCRCGTYPRVYEAALDAASKMRSGGKAG